MDLERLNPISQRFRSKTFSIGPSSSRGKGAYFIKFFLANLCVIRYIKLLPRVESRPWFSFVSLATVAHVGRNGIKRSVAC